MPERRTAVFLQLFPADLVLERTGAAAEVETIGDAGGEIPLGAADARRKRMSLGEVAGNRGGVQPVPCVLGLSMRGEGNQ